MIYWLIKGFVFNSKNGHFTFCFDEEYKIVLDAKSIFFFQNVFREFKCAKDLNFKTLLKRLF